MAAPAALVVVAKKLGKKLIIDVASDPTKALKAVMLILGIVLIISALIILPIALLLNLPSLLFDFFFGGSISDSINQAVMDRVAIYTTVPTDYNNELLNWVEQQKNNNTDCKKFEVNYDFSLTWRELMAIDAVRNNQDFENMSAESVKELARKFITKSVKKEDYKELVETTVIYIENGVEKTRTETVEQTAKKAIITVQTKSFDQVMNELGFNSEDKDIALTMLQNLRGMDIGPDGLTDSSGDTGDWGVFPPGDAKIPHFMQTDSRWGGLSYGNSTIAAGGCGPTSLAMVVAGLTNPNMTPKDMARWSEAHGYRINGVGTAWGLMSTGAQSFGLNVMTVSRKNPNKIVEELSKGNPIIASMGPGHFTSGGHFIVLRGLNENGKILVNDPASVSRTNKAWDVSIVMSESSRNGGDNGSPFWVYTRK